MQSASPVIFNHRGISMDVNALSKLSEAVLDAFGFQKEVQVLYVTLADGQKLVFLGPAMTQDDVEGVQEITFGEHVHAAVLSYTSQRHRAVELQ